ncbi:nuclear transport factor 2 family protein [Sphaerisporangium fuscum]|uniref:nuclear transport factor 2 family protein n=1 Tax=Sphaerisporangium fuscum TaxID=2835868 RepID=UPI001BDDAB1E|nr:nuclear transport factor 2 family protein [Sphaerisporangium fuscum]
MATPTPREIIDRRRRLVLDKDADGFADLFAADGVVELPFAPPGMPRRIEGRDAIRAFSSHAFSPRVRIDDLSASAVYETTDPEVVIVEVESRGTVTATGRPFQGTSVQVFRVRDGEIVLFRDYWNPQGLAEALHAITDRT